MKAHSLKEKFVTKLRRNIYNLAVINWDTSVTEIQTTAFYFIIYEQEKLRALERQRFSFMTSFLPLRNSISI